MDEYFVGIVKEYQKEKIIFEYNNRGFILQGVNLHLLPINKVIKLYVYFYQRLPISEYFAFLNKETKQYFLELISINYIGPKIALKILNFFNLDEFKSFINNANIEIFKNIKGITNKLALSIIEHFKCKNNLYNLHVDKFIQEKWFFVFDILFKLGFNKNIINNYLNSIDINAWNDNLQVIIDKSVKEIKNKYY